MEDKLYWYWLSAMSGISCRKQHQLMKVFLHPKELFLAPTHIIEEKISKKIQSLCLQSRKEELIKKG